MVAVRDKHGKVIFHEPPYTEAEQNEMYRRMDGVVAFTRPGPLGPKTEERPVPKVSQRKKGQDVG